MRFALLAGLAATVLTGSGCYLETYGDYLIEGPPLARITTSLGEFVVELNPDAAPVTVANFRSYAESGFYDGTIFHRVIAGFVVQGGGYVPGLVEKEPRSDPIVLESYNGLRNLRGTIAMARTTDPNSAQAQFFVNLVDNDSLDPTLTQPGYAVFGAVVSGMEVVDAIGAVTTAAVDDNFDAVPAEDVIIVRVSIETGEKVANPLWEAYFDSYLEGVQYEFLTLLRSTLVSTLTNEIAR
ncbi:MAG: peptidylprolyl isomerase [Vicinamibacterales bacterium]